MATLQILEQRNEIKSLHKLTETWGPGPGLKPTFRNKKTETYINALNATKSASSSARSTVHNFDPKPKKPKNIYYSTYTPYYTCFHVVPICCQLNAIGACKRWSGTPKPSHIKSASLPASADSWLHSLLICNRTAVAWPPASQ